MLGGAEVQLLSLMLHHEGLLLAHEVVGPNRRTNVCRYGVVCESWDLGGRRSWVKYLGCDCKYKTMSNISH